MHIINFKLCIRFSIKLIVKLNGIPTNDCLILSSLETNVLNNYTKSFKRRCKFKEMQEYLYFNLAHYFSKYVRFIMS